MVNAVASTPPQGVPPQGVYRADLLQDPPFVVAYAIAPVGDSFRHSSAMTSFPGGLVSASRSLCRYVLCFADKGEAGVQSRLLSAGETHYVRSVSWNELDRDRYEGVVFLPRFVPATLFSWRRNDFRLCTQDEIDAVRGVLLGGEVAIGA